MELFCPNCVTQISQNDLDSNGMQMLCSHCTTVINIRNLIDKPNRKPRKQKAKRLKIPPRIKIERNASELHIQYLWNRFTGEISLIAIVVFAFIGSVFFTEYTNIYRAATNDGELQILEVLLLPLVIIFLLILGTWMVIALLTPIANTTHVKVTKQLLYITQRPLPLCFDVQMNLKDIEAIFTKEHVVEGSGGDDQMTYEVHVITHDGTYKKLVDRLPEQEQASFIKRQIEPFLDIEMLPQSL